MNAKGVRRPIGPAAAIAHDGLLVIRRTRSCARPARDGRRRHRLGAAAAALLACGGAAVACTAAAPLAVAQTPPLPGPPPGAGAGFPLPPAAGSTAAAPPAGPPGAIAPPSRAPALADGDAAVSSAGRLTLSVACRTGGRARLDVPALGTAALARATYACRGGRAAVRMRIRREHVPRLARLSPAVGRVALQERGASARISVALGAAGRPASPGDWSDGGLQCASPSPSQTYLVAPNFTVSPSTSIAVRPWIAAYTTAGGWRWLGLAGAGSSRWLELTATPAGIAQWLQPTGALNPWTWGPVSFPASESTFAVGVFEVIYWYGGRPTYVWRYTRSFVASQPAGSFCAFP